MASILLPNVVFCILWLADRQSEEAPHRVPDEDIDISGEGVVEVLGDVQIDIVTEVVVHVHRWK